MLTLEAKAALQSLLFVFATPESPATMPEPVMQEIECLATNIWFEARGGTFAEKLAIGHVVMNRVQEPHHANSVCGVVFEPEQFSWTHDGLSDVIQLNNRIDRNAWADTVIATVAAYNDHFPDITLGSTHFHANYVEPYWAEGNEPEATYGSHRFYNDVDGPSRASRLAETKAEALELVAQTAASVSIDTEEAKPSRLPEPLRARLDAFWSHVEILGF